MRPSGNCSATPSGSSAGPALRPLRRRARRLPRGATADLLALGRNHARRLLADRLRPRWSGPYSAIAGPVGGVVSWFVLRRILRRHGIANPRETAREWLQWLGMAAVILLLGFDTGRGRIGGD